MASQAKVNEARSEVSLIVNAAEGQALVVQARAAKDMARPVTGEARGGVPGAARKVDDAAR